LSQVIDWALAAWPSLKMPLIASFLLVGFQRVGSWLENEADPEWKLATRAFLRSGAWFQSSTDALIAANSLFDKIFGSKYFSILAIKRSIFITIVVVTTFTILQFINDDFALGQINSGEMKEIIKNQYTSWHGYMRIAMSMPIDYLSIIRIRFLFQQIKSARQPLLIILMSFLVDVIAILFLFETLELTISVIEGRGPGSDTILYFYYHNWKRIIEENKCYFYLQTLLLQWEDSPFFYASLAPSMIFYLCCLGMVLGKALNKVSPWIIWTSTHLQFKKPFRTIFTAGGVVSSGLWLLAAYAAKQL
jgi:hypothetical protein